MQVGELLPLGLLLGLAAAVTSSRSRGIRPPKAKKIPKKITAHRHTRVDPFFWLNDRDDPEVLKYLEAENRYADAMTEHISELRDKVFAEITGRIKKTDMSVPYKLDNFYYYTRFEGSDEYPLYCRKPKSLDADESVMLDVNELAKGQEFFQIGSTNVSYEHDVLAFSVDTVGRRIYTIHFKDLATGRMLDDAIPEVTGNMAWSNDNRTLFYSKQDPVTLRSNRIYRHVLDTDPARDELVYEESDPAFSTYVHKSKSKRYITIGSYQTVTSEYRFLDASDPTGAFRVFLPRRRGHEYDIYHCEDYFYIVTNDQARNFRLMRTRVDQTDRSRWEEVIPHREDVLLRDIEIFRDYYVISERLDGLSHLRVKSWDGREDYYVEFDEPAYDASVANNPEFDTKLLRFHYASMTTPPSVYDFDMASRKRKLLKRQEVLGGFDPDHYRTERLHATAPDGAQVPISIVYHRDTKLSGAAPLILYGYGSYGFSLDATFSPARLSLLDRGFVFAIAHVRGGQELGRQWYDDGRLLKKKNTFTDFIACAEHLIASGYVDPRRIYAWGGSAGGLLVGAVMNMRPELFHAVVAEVPFVDVVTTMLDESIPLTTGEYDEWGDPNKKEFYDYMVSYSPYDNVGARRYPNVLVTTGMHDSQVQYWEPAKWVAKLRAMKKDDNVLLLKTNMDAGHRGLSGRFRQYEDYSLIYAFLLDLAGVGE